jgi:lipid-A-disaccharide synthase-like uncharacterized protein
MSRLYLIVSEIIFVAIICGVAVEMFRQHSPVPGAVHTDMRLPDSRAQVYLLRQADGSYQYFVCHPGQAPQPVSFQELTDQTYHAATAGALASVFGGGSSTIIFWLSLGLFGQLLFTGRMIVQWIVSERHGTSIVPPMFWWMSLVGSLLLLSYFMWRRDPIGLLGQAFGSFVYLRNIIWILEGKKISVAASAQADEPLPQG